MAATVARVGRRILRAPISVVYHSSTHLINWLRFIVSRFGDVCGRVNELVCICIDTISSTAY
jgi:hypothetical protein